MNQQQQQQQQYNGGLLPDIINTTGEPEEFFLYLQPMIPPKRFDIFPPDWRMLRRSRRVQIFRKKSESVEAALDME